MPVTESSDMISFLFVILTHCSRLPADHVDLEANVNCQIKTILYHGTEVYNVLFMTKVSDMWKQACPQTILTVVY